MLLGRAPAEAAVVHVPRLHAGGRGAATRRAR
jgi:hypothetical protein